MRKTILFPTVAFVIMMASSAMLSAQSQYYYPQPVKWNDSLPQLPVVHAAQQNREFPRTHTISYDSEQASVERSMQPSQYLQPLDGEWSRSGSGSAVELSHAYTMPFAWIDRQQFVYIGSAGAPYEVWVNGSKAGYNTSFTSPAEFDITKLTNEGQNTLSIKFFSMPGLDAISAGSNPAITGEVYILSQPRVRIRDYTQLTTFEGSETTVQLGVMLKSHLINPKNVMMHFRLTGPDGSEVTSGRREADIRNKFEDTVRFLINVPDARQWSHESPHMYTLSLRLQHEGRYTEYISYKLGLRTIGVDDGQLLLNGRRTSFSTALYNERLDRLATASKLREMKQSGYNMVKITDSPQPGYFYDLCDSIGLYVCDQADINSSRSGDSRRIGGNATNDPQWKDVYTDRALTMYYTSQNHPSVVMFSLAENSSNGYNLYESYLALKQAELSRPVVYIDAGGEWNTDAVASGRSAAADGRLVFDMTRNAGAGAVSEPGFERLDAAGSRWRVSNPAGLATLRGHLVYTVKQGAKKVAEGTIPVKVGPQDSAEYPIPGEPTKPGKTLKYEVKLEAAY